MQRIIPYLAYEDAPAAISFLRDAFGFEERYRMTMDDGRIGHAEVACQDDNVLFLASLWKEVGQKSPKDLPGTHCQIYCKVDDVDAHFRRAREGGATIIGEPADQPYGERMYRALDPEGHRWMFSAPIGAAADGH
ncbi:MAG TPA: VOC family protein [Bryobacteraceae bacterium]|jgi:uncharacterized glyoxalase superfamily protein PhnB